MTSDDAASRRPWSRRQLLQAAVPAWALGAAAARAQPQLPIPIADMHSHYGMYQRAMATSGLGAEMRSQRVALVAWKLVSDRRSIRATDTGIAQFREPVAGELASFFHDYLDRMRAYVAQQGLTTVLTAADVDACVAGQPGIVLAAEGADFLEGRVDDLAAVYAKGLRHLQLVHYIRNPVGDFQTIAPVHQGLSAMGRQLVEACNATGVLIDLAHSSPAVVDQALEISKAPMIWSHGWVDRIEGRWQDPLGYLQRRLSLAQARRLAARGGVVGLWGLALSNPGTGWAPGQGRWTVAGGDTWAYARELADLADRLGPDHVALGTDIEGVGSRWSVNSYTHVRSVLEHLQELKMPTAAIEKIACGNYARVLKSALRS